MIDYKQDRNTIIFLKAVEKLDLRFPVAEIFRKTSTSQGNVSNFLKARKPVSDNFLHKFLESYNLDIKDFEENKDDMSSIKSFLENRNEFPILNDVDEDVIRYYKNLYDNQSALIDSQKETIELLKEKISNINKE
jgi:hypothetical protein